MAAIAIPENTRVFLLDIEGTTTPITFVKVRAHSLRYKSRSLCARRDGLFCDLLPVGHLISLHQRESGGISVCTLGRGRVQTRCASAQETGQHLSKHPLWALSQMVVMSTILNTFSFIFKYKP